MNEIINQIKELDKNDIIIKKILDSYIYLYELGKNLDPNNMNYDGLIFFENLELKNKLKKEFNLDENEKIYILIEESPNQNEKSAINNYDYIFILRNGTQLNLSNLNEDLYSNISIPIKHLDLANYNYAEYFSDFGYDIYNQNDSFYQNICSPAYIRENDIVINDRKKYIYPNNISLCIKNCNYKFSELDDKRIKLFNKINFFFEFF